MIKYIKKNWSTVLLVLIFTVGLCLLLYPTLSNMWNVYQAGEAGKNYQSQVASLSDSEYEQLWKESKLYNDRLASDGNRYNIAEDDSEYSSLLNINGTGIMAILRIPALNLALPVYHGTSENVLQKYIGHLEGTSLPIGGEGTHAVLSGHRGLPSAKLFTDLPKLVEDDYFMIDVLGETLTYKIDKISTVLPDDYSMLAIEDGKDYVTLMTCTPYGVNTHRLLVRGIRVDNLPEDFMTTRNDALIIDSKIIAIYILIPMLVLIYIYTSYKDRRKKRLHNKYFKSS